MKRAERFERRELAAIERFRRSDGATAMRLMGMGLVEYRAEGGLRLTKAGEAALRAPKRARAAEAEEEAEEAVAA